MEERTLARDPGQISTFPSISALVDELSAIADEFHLEQLRPGIAACRSAIGSGGVVNVAVVGRFKAGKSSFLNRVLGRDVMPVDVLPTTAVITQVSAGPRDRAVVQFLDWSTREIDLSEIADYVTEKANPDNIKRVALVDIQLAGIDHFAGIRFVDTPGLGSVFAHNTETAMKWLPEIGAALVACPVEPPLSSDDVALLAELTKLTPEIVIALTKIDQVSEEQVRAVLEFMEEQIHRHLGRELPIFPVSVKPGFETTWGPIREYLEQRIAGQREERFHEILRHKLKVLTGNARAYLELALRAAEADEMARQQLLAAVERERRAFEAVKNEVWLLANDLKTRARHRAQEGFGSYRDEVLARLQSRFDQDFPTFRGHLAKVSERFRDWLEEVMTLEMKELSPRGEEMLAPYLFDAEDAFGRVVRAFQDRLSQTVERALRTRFQGASFEVAVRQPDRPDVKVDKTFDIPIDMLWFLIPMPLVRPLIRRHLRGRLPWEVEKNLARLGVQWADAVAVCIDDLAAQARAFIMRELETVEELASRAPDRRQQVEEALHRVLDAEERAQAA